MGHSKNDIPFEGGFARIPIKKSVTNKMPLLC